MTTTAIDPGRRSVTAVAVQVGLGQRLRKANEEFDELVARAKQPREKDFFW